MKRLIPLLLALLLLLLMVALVSSATALMVEVPFTDLVSGVDSVVIGTIESIESRWNENHSLIRTYAFVSVERYITGAPVDSMIPIIVDGGAIDGMTLWASDTPTFSPGMRAGFLLREDAPGLYTTYGKIKGVYALANDPVTIIGGLLHRPGLYPGCIANQFIKDVHSARAADTAYFEWRLPGWNIPGRGTIDQNSGKQRDCMLNNGNFTPWSTVPAGNDMIKIMEI